MSGHLLCLNPVVLIFSSIGGHNEQENTLNQLLVEMDGEPRVEFIDEVACFAFFMSY